MAPLVTHFLQVGAVLLVIGFVAALLARRVTQPVDRLTEATRRLGAGDLGYRIPVGRRPERDELGRLELAWNDMASRIETLVGSHRELLANVSHELRSPLARLRVVLELLPESPEVRARTTEIEREVADLDRLVDALLTVARLEAAALPVTHAPVDAAELLEAVRVRGAEGLVREPVRVEAEPGLRLVGDEALLRRALWNLLENAGKYGEPPVTLFARREGGGVRLGVEDDGTGIEPTERERVLAPFVRGARPEATGRGGGFGLGLTLASRIAAAHGGGLSIEPMRREGGRERGCRVSFVAPAEVGAGVAAAGEG
jgi:signal transduction histidine kinase